MNAETMTDKPGPVSRPRCPSCRSYKIELPAFASLHWRSGHWVLVRGSPEMADGAAFHCMGCGARLVNETGAHPPFNLVEEQEPLEVFR
jgi:hypothetical protein